MRVLVVLSMLLLAPLAAAQLPAAPTNNNATAPSVGNGNDGAPVGETESTEKAPGVSYGALVLLGVLAFGGALAWVGWRYARDRRREP